MSDKMNLLLETQEILAAHSKTPAHVSFVMRAAQHYENRPAISFSWAEFAALADFNYNSGYGGNEIEGSLKIVGADWWLERGEYDGSEWWEFKTMPKRPDAAIPCRADLMEAA